MAKKTTVIGIDQDIGYIRAVRLGVEHSHSRPVSGGAKGGAKAARVDNFRLLDAVEFEGEFGGDAPLFDSLRLLKEKMSISSSEEIVTCLSGKQTFAGQMTVKKLPDGEMKSMLKLELRKLMPFEPAAAAFDFHWLPAGPEVSAGADRNAGVPIIVSAATNNAIERHLRVYDKAGVRPNVIDVLPLAAANAFWASRGGEGEEGIGRTYVILYLGSDTCTLVIDGDRSPFFTRSFAFDINGVASLPAGSSEAALQMSILSDEINKSVNYYRNTYRSDEVASITVMGAHAAHPAFETLGRRTGFEVEPARAARELAGGEGLEPGKFDLAAALAMLAA
jgi:Tfp pilus assembly PilM family ATPase